MTMSESLTTTRRSLHGVAELVIAGPQYRRSGTIRLRITPGGFGAVAEPELRVAGDMLVTPYGRTALAGATYAQLAKSARVDAGAPADLYHDGSGVSPDEEIGLDKNAARRLMEAFAAGDAALRRFAPGETPVLWPEHFDLGISVDEINYGISPGDSHHAEPYAYVGPWRQREGEFWNAPFGAAQPLGQTPDAEAIVRFFAAGRAAAAE